MLSMADLSETFGYFDRDVDILQQQQYDTVNTIPYHSVNWEWSMVSDATIVLEFLVRCRVGGIIKSKWPNYKKYKEFLYRGSPRRNSTDNLVMSLQGITQIGGRNSLHLL